MISDKSFVIDSKSSTSFSNISSSSDKLFAFSGLSDNSISLAKYNSNFLEHLFMYYLPYFKINTNITINSEAYCANLILNLLY